jgi:protein SCO1/2
LIPSRSILVALAGGLLASSAATAQYQRRGSDDLDGAFRNEIVDRSREQAGIDEKLGDTIPQDVVFLDSQGNEVTPGDIFAEGKPVVIQMAYYRCPALCGEVMNGMVRSMRDLGGDLVIGRDFEVLTISFDSREPPELAADNKDATVDVMSRVFDEQNVIDGWGFWTGTDLSIDQLTDAIGFRFAWIPEAQQYSHTATIVIATPDGQVSRYLQGPTFDPQTLRLSIVDASDGKLQPSLKDAFVYYCFSFDPTTGKYTATAMTIMKIGGVAVMVTLAFVIGFLVWAERRGKMAPHPNKGTPLEGDEPDDSPPSAEPPSAGSSEPRHAFSDPSRPD